MGEVLHEDISLPPEGLPLPWRPSQLDGLVKDAQKTVFKASSVFPFDIVPDRLVIDLTKVVIVRRELFGMETEHTILLDEVRDVDAEVNYFLGSLRILGSGPGAVWTSVNNLRKNDVHQAKDIIEGLLIAKRAQWDLTQVKSGELTQQVSALGGWDHRPAETD